MIRMRCGSSKEREPQVKMSKHDAEREHGAEIIHETGGENNRGHFRCLPTSRTTTRKPSNILNLSEMDWRARRRTPWLRAETGLTTATRKMPMSDQGQKRPKWTFRHVRFTPDSDR